MKMYKKKKKDLPPEAPCEAAGLVSSCRFVFA